MRTTKPNTVSLPLDLLHETQLKTFQDIRIVSPWQSLDLLKPPEL
jgi:hypothetical protein